MKFKTLQYFFGTLILLFFFGVAAAQNSSSEFKKYLIKINGNLTCKKPEGDIVGMYGAKVTLHILTKQGTLLQVNAGGFGLDPKKLVVDVEEDGSFNFDLQVLSTFYSWAEAFFLEVYAGGDYGYVISDEAQFITKTSHGQVYLFKQSNRGVKLNFDPNKTTYEYNNINIEVNPKIGVTTRYLKIANQFATKLANDIKLWDNVNIPGIEVKITDDFPKNKKNAAGYFTKGVKGISAPRIYILSQNASNSVTISHEFGHYFHYLINEKHIPIVEPSESRIIAIEGFADFYEMLVQNYTKKKYQDILNRDIAEKLPFINPPYSGTAYSNNFNGKSVRFATYLFNLYDGYTQNYMKNVHEGKDNDDIDGRKEGTYAEIFHIIKKMGKYKFTVSNMHARIKSSVSPSVANSIERLHNFIFTIGTTPMLPAQVKSAKLSIAYGGEKYKLSLKTYAYTDPSTLYYKNSPKGYILSGKKITKVSKPINWTFIKQLPEVDGENKDYELDADIIQDYTDFKVTAYNQTGESLHPITFKNSTLPLKIEGPSNIFADITYQWKAKLTGGKELIKYYWTMRKINSDEKLKISGTVTSSYFTSMPVSGQSFILELWVQDSELSTAYAEMKVNTTIRPLKPQIIGLPPVTANVTYTWESYVTGGVPPYTYNWIKKVEGHPALIFLGQGTSCTTKSDKPFTLKLTVKDSKGSTAVVEQLVQINILAPIIPTITGPILAYLHENTSNWKVSMIGGKPPYEVKWMRKYADELYYSFVADGTTYQKNYGGKDGTFYLKTVIKDINGMTKESAPFKVTSIYQPLYTAILNDDVIIKVGEKINWQADIAGGKPTYHCTWRIGKDINNLSIIKEGYIGYEFHPSCEYQPEFNKAGKYMIALTIRDALNKSITIYKDFIVQGKGITTKQFKGKVDNQSISNLSIYPNPNRGQFTLRYQVKDDADVSISLISTNNNIETKIYQQKIVKGIYQNTFNTSNFPIGNYILKIAQKNTRGEITFTTEKLTLLK